MWVVLLKREYIITFLLNNKPSNHFLTSHCISRYDAVFDGKCLNEFRDCGNLIRFVGNLQLTKDQTIRRSPRAHHMDWSLFECRIVRMTQRFAINRNHFTLGELTGTPYPSDKARLKLFRIDTGKDAPEGVMRWNPIW